ncbi:MAG: efflux RND transporter permease subunit [Planctomycetota bacterium]
MSALAAFGVKKPVVANLVMFAIIGAGIIFGSRLTREFFPEIRPTQVSVSAPYPGAAPEEVEDALAVKIEDAIADLSDVKEINSTVTEGAASVLIEFKEGVNIDARVAEVKREMDALQDLPDATDRIIVTKIEAELPAVILALYGDVPERELKDAIRDIRDDLRTLPDMGELRIGGIRTDEIVVEVRPSALLEHNLGLADVADRINQAMIELPGGSIRAATSNVSIRSLGLEERAATVREVVVKSLPDGRVVRLDDVATVYDGFSDIPTISRLNGKPAVNLTVFQSGDDDYVTMADLVKAYVAGRNGEQFKPTVLERVSMLMAQFGLKGQLARAETDEDKAVIQAQLDDPWSLIPATNRIAAYQFGKKRSDIALPGTLVTTTDLSRIVTGRLDLLTRNALFGGLLVFLVLVLLLNWRVSFWVAAGLLISLLGTVAVMYFAGVTLNVISMFGLIIVIGILVDDAIVVAENITARHEKGEPALVAAINGTRQVNWPVVATVLTSVCTFLPLALVEGQIGDFLGVLPVIVGVSLLVSLIESLFILPSHMGHSLKSADKAHARHKEGILSKLDHRLDRGREWFFGTLIVPRYMAVLRWCVRAPYTATAISVAIVIGSVGMIAGGRLEFIFFEEDDAETISVELSMPIGTPLAQTESILAIIEDAIESQGDDVASYFTSAGSISALDGSGAQSSFATHIGQIIIELKPVESRDRPSPVIIQDIRREFGTLTGVKSLRIAAQQGGPGGAALNYTLVGNDQDQLEAAGDALMQHMATFAGVVDISTDSESGQRELRFDLKDGAAELGFTRASLGRQLQGFAFGIEAFTFAGEREDVDIRVLLPEDTRRSLAAIEDQYVFTPQGQPVPLREVANITEGEAYATIRRLDRKKAVAIQADVDRSTGANPDEVSAAIAPFIADLPNQFPGVNVELRGRQQDFADSFATLPIGMAAACGLIYVILAWLFGSYTQPLVVMTAIPFASIGMIWGHVVLGYAMTFLSLIGFVALSGIVVNDSLIFMEFFNGKRRDGLDVREAALEAGRARVRAILLTTITTVIGLTPLLLEPSFQAKFLIPMAITICGGLISATGIILIVLPCLLVILHDIRRVLVGIWTGEMPDQLPAAGIEDDVDLQRWASFKQATERD